MNLRSVSARRPALLAGAFVLPAPMLRRACLDVLGTYQDKDVIEVSGAPSYLTLGKMNMTTVSVSWSLHGAVRCGGVLRLVGV